MLNHNCELITRPMELRDATPAEIAELDGFVEYIPKQGVALFNKEGGIMRDPIRFAKLSLLFLNVWRNKYPALRFLQFVHFLVSKYHNGSDAFYVSDNAVIDWLEQELKKGE